MRRVLWVSALLLAAAGTFGGIADGLAAPGPASPAASQQVAGNGVTVTAALLRERPDSTAIKLTLDTYFVNLIRYDFEELVILRDDTGRTYPVTGVEQIGSRKPRYRQAVVRFSPMASEAKMIELIVKDVAGVKERTFRWSAAQ